MKKIVLMTVLLMIQAGAAMAQERQVYPAYPQDNVDPAVVASQQQQYQRYLMRNSHAGRVYPGREGYGTHFGPIPRHPGDYRDAVDRGMWSAGESTRQGGYGRNFSID